MTLGKTVTTEKGRIVTDIGPGSYRKTADGPLIPCEILRRCITDDGEIVLIINRIIEQLPETIRRDSFVYRPDE